LGDEQAIEIGVPPGSPYRPVERDGCITQQVAVALSDEKVDRSRHDQKQTPEFGQHQRRGVPFERRVLLDEFIKARNVAR